MGESVFSSANVSKAVAKFEPASEPADTAVGKPVGTPVGTPGSDTGDTAGSGEGAKTVGTEGLTPAQKKEFDEAAKRAKQIQGTLQEARIDAKLDEQAAKRFQELATDTDDDATSAIAESRVIGATTESARKVREAEEDITTDFAGSKGRVTIPRAPKDANIRAAAARIRAKREQVDSNLTNANTRRASKIRQLAEARTLAGVSGSPTGEMMTATYGEGAGLTSRTAAGPEELARIRGLEAEVKQLSEYTENLLNLDRALEAIQEKTLGQPPRVQKDVEGAKAELAGQAMEFDPDESVRAATEYDYPGSPYANPRVRKKLREIAEGTRSVDADLSTSSQLVAGTPDSPGGA